VDIPIQFSAYRDQRHRWRTALWVIGTVFAAALAYFWMTALISAINF
jgi:hypothetical protein